MASGGQVDQPRGGIALRRPASVEEPAAAPAADAPSSRWRAVVDLAVGRRHLSPAARRRLGVLALVIAAVVVYRLARTMQEDGHGWGDDFAMYINQARGLADGSADEVVATNRFALDNSAYRFGPVAYPWAFPALLAPIVMWWGIDYSALKLVGTLSLVGAVVVYALLLRPRLEPWEQVIAVAFLGFNSWYLAATDQVLSDVPFLFTFLLALLLIDRLVRNDRLLGPTLLPLIVLGAVIALSFNVRREGMVLLLAVAAAQIVAVLRRDSPLRRRVRALATPYATFVVFAAVVHFVRPATVFNRDVGVTGFQNVSLNVDYYMTPLAELLGVKEVGPTERALFGHQALGTAVLVVFLAAAALGLVAAFVRQPRRDAHLAVATLGLVLIVLVQPFREGRYLYTILPLLVYFAMRGLRTVVGVVGGRSPIAAAVRLGLPAAIMIVPLSSVADDTLHALDYHADYEYTHWGPEAPASQELFAAIEQFTDERDVIVFQQARTMALMTRRKAIQGNNVAMMVERGDWYAMVRDSDYIQTPLTDQQAAELGFEKVWENDRYVLWSIPDRPVEPVS